MWWAHPELLEQATQIVQGYPKLRKMDEIEERKRERQERKLRKSQGKWGVLIDLYAPVAALK